MMQQEFTAYSYLANLRETAQQLLAYGGIHKIWLFTGDLGAGKTTLIKAICAELGIVDAVTSPTFALVHEYALPTGKPVHHLDAYRIEYGQETTSLELQPYFDQSQYYCFVEWPSKLEHIVFPTHVGIHIASHPGNSRHITANILP